MKRTPEHEKLIDELVANTGHRREVVEKVADRVVKHMINQFVEKAVGHLLNEISIEGLATGGIVEGRPHQILTNEYVVPKGLRRFQSSDIRLSTRGQRAERGRRK